MDRTFLSYDCGVFQKENRVKIRAWPPGGVGWVGAPQKGTIWVLGGYFSDAGGVDFSGGLLGGRILVKVEFSGG